MRHETVSRKEKELRKLKGESDRGTAICFSAGAVADFIGTI
jgi:hypothetical protein